MRVLILGNMWSLLFGPPTLCYLIFLLCIDKCFDWKWIFDKRCLGATINSSSCQQFDCSVLKIFFFFMCLTLPKNIAWVFCLLWRKRDYFLFWWCQCWGCTLNSYSRVNLQSHILRETWNILSELSWLLERKNASMMPNQQKGSLMSLVVDLQNVLIIQAFLITLPLCILTKF